MRIALVADIHGNLPALDAVVADMAGRGVDLVVNLGDCVSGPLWPRETLRRLRALGWPTVRGNHDRCVGGGTAATLGPSDAFAVAEVGPEGCGWLAALPGAIALAPGVVGLHATPAADDAYLTEDIVDGRLVAAAAATVAARLGPPGPGPGGAGIVFTAHSHRAATLRLPDGRWIVNPGSVGCPAYDDPDPPAHVSESLSPAARYALVEVDAAAAFPVMGRVELIAIPYDHASAARRAAALGRPEWAHALAHGMMPDRGAGHGASETAP